MEIQEVKTAKDGARVYQGTTDTGKVVMGPSVTTVLHKPNPYAKPSSEPNPYALRGTECHKLIELYFSGVVPTGEVCTTDAWDYYQALQPHLGELRKEATEQSVLVESPYGAFGGTVDFVGYLEGERVIVDWKTTSKNPSKDSLRKWGYQLAAYSHALGDIDSAWIYASIKPKGKSAAIAKRWKYDRESLNYYWAFFQYRLGVWHENHNGDMEGAWLGI